MSAVAAEMEIDPVSTALHCIPTRVVEPTAPGRMQQDEAEGEDQFEEGEEDDEEEELPEVSLDIFDVIKSSQAQHGLRHGDHERCGLLPFSPRRCNQA